MRVSNRLIYSLITAAVIQNVPAQNKFENGVFVLNEDWFGKNNSSVNFLNTETGEFDYMLVQNNSDNGNLSLGCTAQYGVVYGDNIYVI